MADNSVSYTFEHESIHIRTCAGGIRIWSKHS